MRMIWTHATGSLAYLLREVWPLVFGLPQPGHRPRVPTAQSIAPAAQQDCPGSHASGRARRLSRPHGHRRLGEAHLRTCTSRTRSAPALHRQSGQQGRILAERRTTTRHPPRCAVARRHDGKQQLIRMRGGDSIPHAVLAQYQPRSAAVRITAALPVPVLAGESSCHQQTSVTLEKMMVGRLMLLGPGAHGCVRPECDAGASVESSFAGGDARTMQSVFFLSQSVSTARL